MTATVKFWITIMVTLAVAFAGTGTVILLRALDKATDWGEVKATVHTHTQVLKRIESKVDTIGGFKHRADEKDEEPEAVIGMAKRP